MLESGFQITEVIEGGAMGVDMLAWQWARTKGLRVTEIKADWEAYGKSAGPRRNAVMASQADAVIVIWNGHSRGTHNMMETAHRYRLPLYVLNLGNAPNVSLQPTTAAS